jgi:hypothetical protein
MVKLTNEYIFFVTKPIMQKLTMVKLEMIKLTMSK